MERAEAEAHHARLAERAHDAGIEQRFADRSALRVAKLDVAT
jgi:hypothetical protein